MRKWWFVLSVFALCPSLFADDTAIIRSEFVYEQAPFPSCHATTIEETKPGELVAAWFGGTEEKNPDVGIWVARHDGSKWSPPVEVANGIQYVNAQGKAVRHPCWNPVLFQTKTGPLWLFYKVGPNPSSWWGMLTISEDRGQTWSVPRRLPEGIVGPVKNKPIQLTSGEILCGTSTEDKGWRVHFERTNDGVHWQRTDVVNDGNQIGAIQPSFLKLGDSRLLAVGRTRQGKVFQIESTDAGKSWGTMSLTELPNPNAGTDAITLRDGRHLLVYNPTERGRSPLSVALSTDAKTWKPALVLESKPGEYSYPAVIQAADGNIHITYTWKRERVRHVVIDPQKLKAD